MSRQSIDRLMWVAHNMPEENKLALERFVKVNPAWNGANWEDVLDVLLDSDSHLELTEPLIEEAMDEAGEWYEGMELISEVAVTLLWAYAGNPTLDEIQTVLERAPLERS